MRREEITEDDINALKQEAKEAHLKTAWVHCDFGRLIAFNFEKDGKNYCFQSEYDDRDYFLNEGRKLIDHLREKK